MFRRFLSVLDLDRLGRSLTSPLYLRLPSESGRPVSEEPGRLSGRRVVTWKDGEGDEVRPRLAKETGSRGHGCTLARIAQSGTERLYPRCEVQRQYTRRFDSETTDVSGAEDISESVVSSRRLE